MDILLMLLWLWSGLAFFVCLIFLIVKMAKGKPTTKMLIATLVCLAVSIGSIALRAAISCDHEYEVISQTEPTCTVDGEIVSVCSLCGNETIEVLVATGHTMVLMSETQPTVQENGEIVYACSVCGTEYVEEIDNSEVVAAYEAEQAEKEASEEFSDIEPVISDESDIKVSSVTTIDGERVTERVALTRAIDGIKVRTVTTKTEGVGIVKILETIDIVEGLDSLLDFGFSQDDLDFNREVLDLTGIGEVYITDYFETSDTMGVARALIYDSEGMQLNLTFENNRIFFVGLTDIVEDFDYLSTRKDKLDLGVGLQGSSNVDMYYDFEGGLLAVLDWENKTLEVHH